MSRHSGVSHWVPNHFLFLMWALSGCFAFFVRDILIDRFAENTLPTILDNFQRNPTEASQSLQINFVNVYVSILLAMLTWAKVAEHFCSSVALSCFTLTQ